MQGFEKLKDYKNINEMMLVTQKHSFQATPLLANIQHNKNGIVEFSNKGTMHLSILCNQ